MSQSSIQRQKLPAAAARSDDLRCCNQVAKDCHQVIKSSGMPEPASRHYTSAWYLFVSFKNQKMCSRSSCGLRNDRCPTKALLLYRVAASRCRLSGRPFDESLSRSNIRSTFTSGWIKRIKYALISVPIWTALSLVLFVSFLKRCS